MRLFPTLTTAALSAFVLVTSAQAQTEASAQPDAARLKLAREILTANGGEQAMETQMRALFSSMTTLTMNALPKTDPKAADIIQTVMKYMVDEEIKALPAVIDQTANVYATNLTQGELRDMLAWTVSPSGRSIRTKMPLITQQLISQQGPLVKKMIAGAATTAIDRACADAKCTADQRKALASITAKLTPAS